MKQRSITVSIIWANIFGIILFLFVALASSFVWYLVWGYPTPKDFVINSFLTKYSYLAGVLIFISLVAGTIIHELIHGITWAYFSKKKFRSIKFGIMWEMLTPYCHCSAPLGIRQYIIGALMPLIILGIIPLMLAYPLKNIFLLIWGQMFIASAAGDILIVWKLHKESSSCIVLDHPKEAGCIIFDNPIQ